MPNDINSLSPDIRDVILNRNLRLPDYIEGYNYDTYAGGVNGQGIGEPVNIGDVTGVLDLSNASNIGVYYRSLQTVGNQYQPLENEEVNIIVATNTSSSDGEYGIVNSSDFDNGFNQSSNDYRFDNLRANLYSIENLQRVNINQNPQFRTRRVGSYLDEYGDINLGGYSVEPINILGSLASGGLLSDGQGGVDTSFDVRSSILGRTLTAVGVLDDTPLGVIGGQALATQLFNNVANNTQQEVLGKINDPLSIIKGDLFVEEYRITSTDTFLDIGTDLLGFNIPISTLPKDIFFGNGSALGGNISRANSIIERTGSGQNKQRNRQINENKFRAGFTNINFNPYVYMDVDGNVITFEEKIANSENFGINGLGSSPKTFDNIKENFDNLIGAQQSSEGYGFSWDEPNSDGFLDSDNLDAVPSRSNPNSLLLKTKTLFDEGYIRTLDAKRFKIDDYGEVQTSGIKNGSTLFVSKGSGVVNPETGEFCRVWTKKDGYDTVSDLQKNRGLLNRYDKSETALSVLQDNGFVKITPQIGDKGTDIKKFMFSIENLAWSDSAYFKTLPECEKGNGDPVTGTKGRIMWFPPYELSFNDNTSVKWDSHDFIGRGEPVYTYTNSERSGNLSFKMIIDTPDIVNELANQSLNSGVRENLIALFSGCIDELPSDIKQLLSEDEIRAKKVAEAAKATTKNADPIPPLGPFKVHFLNDVTSIEANYENGDGTPYGSYVASALNSDGGGSSTSQNDTRDDGLNVAFNEALNGSIKDYITKNKNVVLEITGYASKAGTTDRNQVLSDQRAEAIKDQIESLVSGTKLTIKKIVGLGDTQSASGKDDDINSTTAKEDRKATFTLKVDQTINNSLNTPNTPSNDELAKSLAEKVIKRSYKECDYFNKLSQDDKFVDGVEQLYKKIKFFHPSFHSTTPEGFNSRLNFLLQCTKQGETVRRDKDGKPTTDGQTSNLVFGKPPVCILRIGDFYNTKIIMESVNFSFDPLVWDLNPEGVGVQPMIVNVDIAFKFIGGSSMAGPINKLQNAVSFNFFANTEFYDGRADRITKNGFQSGDDDDYQKDIDEKAAKEKTKSSEDAGLGGNKEIEKDQVAENEFNLGEDDDEESLTDVLIIDKINSNGNSVTLIFSGDLAQSKDIRFTVMSRDGKVLADLGSETFDVGVVDTALQLILPNTLEAGTYYLKTSDPFVGNKPFTVI